MSWSVYRKSKLEGLMWALSQKSLESTERTYRIGLEKKEQNPQEKKMQLRKIKEESKEMVKSY